jgi:hypothetical protein
MSKLNLALAIFFSKNIEIEILLGILSFERLQIIKNTLYFYFRGITFFN